MQGNRVQGQFFGQQNETQLCQTLVQEYQQTTGGLTEKQQTRLVKTVRHYMEQVWDANGPMPIPQLNREVLQACSTDFTTYLRRDKTSSVNLQSYGDQRPSVAQLQYQQPAQLTYQAHTQSQGVSVPPRGNPTTQQGLFLDTGSRYEQLQQERQPPTASRPQIPDFKVSMEDDSTVPALTLFEQAKKMREEEMARVKQTTPPPPPSTFGQETTFYPQPQQQQQQQADSAESLLVRYMATPTTSMNDANQNPTVAQPIAPAPRGPLPQDILIKQDDIISYKETEYNLFIYSADRDWLTNTKETRYSFSVNFDPANNKQGFTINPSANIKFKNISRIELVKAIVPTEGLTNIVQKTGGTFNTNPRITILNYPYVLVRVAELDNNNYGTDDNLNNAFGVLQYDANWYPDTTNLTDGFLAMIPKFMKCQKVYHPTPLATLNKLTIQLQLPNGSLISDTSDTLTISNLYFGDNTGLVYNGNYNTSDYIVLQMSTALNSWFNQWAFTEGNTIQIKGLDITQMNSYSTNTAAATDFAAWLQRDAGHTIVGIGNSTGVTKDGPNAVGYGNLIILRNRFNDPATGSTALQPFGGAANNSSLGGALANTTSFAGAKLINLTHQTHLVFRVVTRELDPTARIRPDNL